MERSLHSKGWPWIVRSSSRDFDLRLIPAVKDVRDIPTGAKV